MAYFTVYIITVYLSTDDVLCLPFFALCCRMLEYSLNLQSVSFSAVRTVRVLRPLRAINRVPSELNPLAPLHLSPPQQTLHPRTCCSFKSKHSSFLWRQITLLFFCGEPGCYRSTYCLTFYF